GRPVELIEELTDRPASLPKAFIALAALPGRLVHYKQNRVQFLDPKMVAKELLRFLLLLQEERQHNELAVNRPCKEQRAQCLVIGIQQVSIEALLVLLKVLLHSIARA